MAEVILEPQKVVFMYLVPPTQKAYILNKIPHNNSSWNTCLTRSSHNRLPVLLMLYISNMKSEKTVDISDG